MDRWDLVINVLIPGAAVIAFLLIVCNEVAVADRVVAVREHRKNEEAKRKSQNEAGRAKAVPAKQQESSGAAPEAEEVVPVLEAI